MKRYCKIYVIVITFLCISIIVLADTDSENIFETPNPLTYYYNCISPDQNKLIVEEWNFDKDNNSFIQKLNILDLNTKKVFAQFLPSDFSKSGSYIELSSICWDREAKNVFFTISKDNNIVYQWNIENNAISNLIIGTDSISHLSTSPKGKYLTYIEYFSAESPKLQLFSFSFNKTTTVEANVDNVTPIWIDENNLVFAKNNAIFSYNIISKKKIRLNSFKSLNISYMKFVSGSKLLIMLKDDVFDKSSRSVINNVVLKEIWIHNLKSNRSTKLISFSSNMPGIDIIGNKIIFPLSLEDKKSCLLTFNYETKYLEKITYCSEKDDLPLFNSNSKTIFFRRNNKKIMVIK